MTIIKINIQNKIAKTEGEALIVCYNKDYVINFAFDEEWQDEIVKTAVFTYNGITEEVVFEGNSCTVPMITRATQVEIGVYAGDLRTSTSAIVPCLFSSLDKKGLPKEPTEDVYAQIMELLNKYIEQGGGGGGFTKDEIENIIKEYLKENPIEDGKDGFSPTITVEQIENGNRVYITDINGTKQFDVLNGKDGESPSIDLTEYQKKTDEGLKTDSKSIIGAINELFDRPTSGGGDTTEGNYELIEKIVIGYSITTAQPEDWATNYTAYFTNTGIQKEPIYTAVSGDTAPTWEVGTYYSFDSNAEVKVARKKTIEGENYKFKKMILSITSPSNTQKAGYANFATDFKSPNQDTYKSQVNLTRLSQTNNITNTFAYAKIENGKLFLLGGYGSGASAISVSSLSVGSYTGLGDKSVSLLNWNSMETNAKYITEFNITEVLFSNAEVYILGVK